MKVLQQHWGSSRLPRNPIWPSKVVWPNYTHLSITWHHIRLGTGLVNQQKQIEMETPFQPPFTHYSIEMPNILMHYVGILLVKTICSFKTGVANLWPSRCCSISIQ